MKFFSAFLFFALLAVCERPPEPRNADHSQHDHSKMDHAVMESSVGAAEAPQELQFIDTMIVHHQGAVEMALLVPTRSQRPELKLLAQTIIADQRKEIGQMKEWRAKWFGEAKPAINMDFPGMRLGMGGMDMKKLDSLKANEFDVEFVRQMISHHEGAVEMARVLKGSDSYAELKTLADGIIESQTAEIGQMKQWLKTWSGKP